MILSGMKVLTGIALQHGRRHLARTLLLILGIALGVSGVVAIDIAKTSVSRSFDISTGMITGRATHRIMGAGLSLDQSLFTHLRVGLGVNASAPVISAYTTVAELQDRQMQFLGIDPFSERPFRSFSLSEDTGSGQQNMADILMGRSGVLISREIARTHGLDTGDLLTLTFGLAEKQLPVAGFLDGTSAVSDLAFTGLIIADIATAQEVLSMEDRISYIDLIIDEDAAADTIRAGLPPGAVLVTTARSSQALRSLSSAFETSLTAFSMLALFMGMFLIYNTVSFSVTQRKQLTGVLRSLGATRQAMFLMVLLEVTVYGIIGSAVGIGLGILMGKAAVQAVCSTVSDMYFVLTVSRTEIAAPTLFKGAAAGLFSCLAATLIPALSAARVPPVTLSRRSASETRLARLTPVIALAGAFLLAGAAVILKIPHTGTGMDYLAIFMMFTGSSFLVPLLTRAGIRLLSHLSRRMGSLVLQMALNNIVRSLSRTGILIASLMVVTSVYIGIGTMTASFRASVVGWVDGNIGGDVHVRTLDSTRPSIAPDLVRDITTLDGVSHFSAYNMHEVLSDDAGTVHLFSYTSDYSEKEWVWTAAPEDRMPDLLDQGWIQVSEIFAARHQIPREKGAVVHLRTNRGRQPFKVAGIFRDFFMGGGRVIVGRDTMARFWGYSDITSLQLFLAPGRATDGVIEKIQSMGQKRRPLEVRSGKKLKQAILAVFDNTFLITTALQILTAVVALTGIINAVMALLLERTREVGILRACGAEAGQVGRMMVLECGFCGLIAGITALPFGMWLSWILISVINQRSFGWTYDLVIQPSVLFQALFMAGAAAAVAGIIPAIKAGRHDISRALRME